MPVVEFKSETAAAMTRKYIAMLTHAGENRIAQAALNNAPVRFAFMGVGDGGGQTPAPYSNQPGLINEQYRARLNRLIIADQRESVIRAELLIPAEIGGFYIREAALFDDDGVCLAVCNVPESYKPQLSQGAGRLQRVSMLIAVSNTASVQLFADPAVSQPTIGELNRVGAEAKDYTDEAAAQLEQAISDAVEGAETQLTQAIKNAVTQALADAWENDNPVGTVRFFNQNINPNQRWLQSRWVYTGENRSIRVAAANGSNVGGTGGSDTVTIQQANLPAVQIDVSGATSEQAAVGIRTTEAGNHQHGTFGEAASIGNWPYGYYDAEHVYLGTSKSDADNALMNSTPDGAHYHDATVPAHGHSVTGKTAALGQGQAVSVVESHILLMCWTRVA